MSKPYLHFIPHILPDIKTRVTEGALSSDLDLIAAGGHRTQGFAFLIGSEVYRLADFMGWSFV
tara:strand:- start:1340 stop:1528 length:189 start_codon:yes stop_codon:yes gene_type:complete